MAAANDFRRVESRVPDIGHRRSQPVSRPILAPFAASDLMATAGYFIAGSGSCMQIQFLAGLHGYLDLSPRRSFLRRHLRQAEWQDDR